MLTKVDILTPTALAYPRKVAPTRTLITKSDDHDAFGGFKHMTDMQYRRYANTGLGEWVPEMGMALHRPDTAGPATASISPAPAAQGVPEAPLAPVTPVNPAAQSVPVVPSAPPAPSAPPTQAQPVPSNQAALPLEQIDVVRSVKARPRQGWRKLVHGATGGKFNPGQSRREEQRARVTEAIRTPLHGDYRIAVMSLKGGVGKTTTTVALGSVLAQTRGDRVIAIDANPDFGTLAQRVATPGPGTIRDLLTAEDTTRYAQVKAFTTQGNSRLDVIGSERDPAVSEAFSEEDYRRAVDILQHHYNLILTDCGTGLMHSAMAGVLDLAHTLVLVSSPALDGAQSASATLDWLELHGYGRLAANAVVVISDSSSPKPTVDMDSVIAHFAARTRAVHVIPYDPHLAEGAVVDIDRLRNNTLRCYRNLAATIAADFSSTS